MNDFAEPGAMYIENSPFVEITFYNSLFTHVRRSFLDVVKVLYSDQIYRTGTVNKIPYTLSAMAAFFSLNDQCNINFWPSNKHGTHKSSSLLKK